MKYFLKYLAIVLATLLLACGGKTQETGGLRDLKNYNISLTDLVDSLHVSKNDAKILVSKSDYTLSVVAHGEVVKTYPIVLGTNPVDDKLREGDCCTPEGKFKIRAKYPHGAIIYTRY